MSDQSALSAKTSLVGATVVVTRPAGSARGLLFAARACGGAAIALPGLTLRLTSDAGAARTCLLAAQYADDWIFSSPAAVRFAFRLMPALQPTAPARLFAIGRGSAAALARRGLRAQIPGERSDSEALLALPELNDVRGRRIALIGAAGGRALIAPTLRERSAEVSEIHVYERGAPRLTRRHFDAMSHARGPLLTVLSSAEALMNLIALLPPALLAKLRRHTLVVSSARLAAIAADNGFNTVALAASALPEDLLAAAARALAQHRL